MYTKMSITLTDTGRSTIVIPENTLRPGEKYKLQVSVSESTHQKATAEHIIITNLPPLAGNCSINPTEGIYVHCENYNMHNILYCNLNVPYFPTPLTFNLTHKRVRLHN